MKWDKWQKEIIEHKGSVTLRSGRQVGKSTAIGYRASKLMLRFPKSVSLMIAPSQRQSSELFIKMLSWLMVEHEKLLEKVGGYKDNEKLSSKRNLELRNLFEREHGIFQELPTKTTVKLKNGSICYSLPAGKTGIYLRTYSLDFLYIDEAAYVPDTVYTALKPMLAVATKKNRGWECFLSTPFGKGGFFYESFKSDDYMSFHVNSEDCPRIPREFLQKEKRRLSRLEYTQEYLGEFIDEYQQYFSTALIKTCMTFIRWNYKEHYNKKLRYYLGVDYAGPGVDVNGFVTAEMQPNNNLKIIMPEELDEPNTVKTNRRIAADDRKFNYRGILVDSGGFGCGPTDELREMLGRKVIGINNAKKAIGVKTYIPGSKPTAETEIKNKILKEDLYSNAKVMMEQGKVDIIDSTKLLASLRSMTFEHTEDRNLKITGRNNHLAEAFVRVCWAIKTKRLNIFVY